MARRVFAGRMKGERRSRQRGTSVEFADFRDYTPGDDPRFVDWNIYGRHGRLSIKLFHEEEDLPVYFLIDVSASMGFGEPRTKLRMAQELAAALGYVAAAGMDRVSLGALAAENQVPDLPARRGRQAITALESWLQRLTADGPTSLATSVRRYCLRLTRPGLVIVLSDFLDPAGHHRALSQLVERGCEVHALHIMTPEELDPSLTGDLRLLDAERGEFVEVTMTPRLIQRYKATVETWLAGIQADCRRRSIGYMLVRTTDAVDQTVLRSLRRTGLVQ
jgi:uncharacterized protein (DUF58 family)